MVSGCRRTSKDFRSFSRLKQPIWIEFGTQNLEETVDGVTMPAVTVSRLGTTTQATEKEFDAEIPTHKITVNINNTSLELFCNERYPINI